MCITVNMNMIVKIKKFKEILIEETQNWRKSALENKVEVPFLYGISLSNLPFKTYFTVLFPFKIH